MVYKYQQLNYVFGLNAQYDIDAMHYGSILRFANSSDSRHGANMLPKVMMSNGEHHIMFFATQDIDEGDELLFDYGYSDANKKTYGIV